MNTSNNHTYSLKDWTADFDYICERKKEAILRNPPSMDWDAVHSHFRSKYGAASDVFRNRMYAADRFLDRNAESLNEGNIAIAGRTHHAIGRPLVQALWCICCEYDPARLADALTVETVLRVAREIQAL